MSASALTPLPPGYVGTLDDAQSKALAEFLAVADGAQIDEVKFRHETRETFSCRLLRARKFDVSEAKALLDKIVAWWRRENLPALIATDNDGALQNCYEDEVYPFYQHTWPALNGCFDKAGRPIYVEKTGKIDVEALEIISDSDALLRWHIRSVAVVFGAMIERATVRAGDRIIDCNCTILDLEGFSMKSLSSASRAHLSRITSIGKDYFPETMGVLFIVNAPRVFSMAWNIIKGMLDERSREKIHILGDRAHYLPKLLEYISADNLPTEYGGTHAIPGGLFPKSTVEEISVDSGKTFHKEITLQAGQKAHVRWWCRPVDMEFAIHVAAPGGVHPVPPSARSDPKKVLDFEYTATVPCKLGMTWDNRKGWRHRDVCLRLRVSEPPAEPKTESAPETVTGGGAGGE